MPYALLADGIVVVHLAFVAFVVAGGTLALAWPRIVWAHLPAVGWGAWIEFSGSICPLTPLENALRRLAGEAGYAGGFVEHYLLPVLYPDNLGPTLRMLLGTLVIVINTGVYVWLWRARRR